MFVGIHRRAEVERLVTLFDRTRERRVPTLVVYTALPGWGKSRIIQELYRELAARQPQPAFWPPELPGAGGAVPAPSATATRKVVQHRLPFDPPVGAVMPWLWLAPAVGRLSDGSPAPAMHSLNDQVARFTRMSAGRHIAAAKARHQGLHAMQTAGGAPLPMVVILDDAHDLDSATADVVTGLLASELPALLIAATWPGAAADDTPFATFIADARRTDRVRVVHLGALDRDDLVSLLVAEYPGTDPRVCQLLAARASGNPYALQLLLNTPLVQHAVAGDRITLSEPDIAGLSGQLDLLLHAHWQGLPAHAKRLLAAAALLGPICAHDVLAAAVRGLGVDSAAEFAIAAGWLRPTGGPDRLLEFVEQPRFELTRSAVPNVLTSHEQATVRLDALRATKALLPAEPDGAKRAVLLASHYALAREGVETDLLAAAASTLELSGQARARRAPEAIRYLEHAGQWLMAAKAWRQLVDCRIDLSYAIQLERRRQDAEPVALEALELADAHLAQHDELRVRARLALASTRRRRRDVAAYRSCEELLAEAAMLFERQAEPSAALRRELWTQQLSKRTHDGDYAGCIAGSLELVEFCEQQYGRHHRWTIAALRDLGFRLQRCRPREALDVRRDVLARLVDQAPSAGLLPTAGARMDLAITLLTAGSDGDLAEAERLAGEAVSLWARTYGLGGARSLRGRLTRARVWRRLGLADEQTGDTALACQRYLAAAEETGAVLALRRSPGFDADDADLAFGLQRHGESLAYLRDPAAVELLNDALRSWELDLRQDAGAWSTRGCARSLWWAYRRLDRPREADHVARQYRLPPGGGPPP